MVLHHSPAAIKWLCITILFGVMLAACGGESDPKSRAHEAYALLDSAQREHERGHPDRVAQYMHQLRSIPREQLSDEVLHLFDMKLAGFAFDAQDYETSLNVLCGLIDVPSSVEQPPPAGISLLIAHSLKKIGDTTMAIDWYRLAEAQITSNVVADINRNLAWLFAAQRQYDSAWARYHRSLELSEPRELSDINGKAWFHFIAGRLHLARGNHRFAYTEIDKGLQVLEQLRITLARAEVNVRYSLTEAVAKDVRFHTDAKSRWGAVLQRIDNIHAEDQRRIADIGLEPTSVQSRAFASIEPFLAFSRRRSIQPWTRIYLVTGAATDERGWMWLATLDGLYLRCGASMIPVRSESHVTRRPLQHIEAIGSALRITRYGGHIDTLRLSELAPQSPISTTPLLASLSWERVHDSIPRPSALATILGTDSLFAVYPNGTATLASLHEQPRVVPFRSALPGTATSVALLQRDSILVGTTQGLWLYQPSTHVLTPIRPRINAGLFQQIDLVHVLGNGNIAVSSSAIQTAIYRRGQLEQAIWSSTSKSTLLGLSSSISADRSLVLSVQRMRVLHTHNQAEAIPDRLRTTVGAVLPWQPSRSFAIVSDSLACFTGAGHIAIADVRTRSVALHELPQSSPASDSSMPTVFRVDSTRIALVRDSSLYIGSLTLPRHRPGMTMVAVRTIDSGEYSILSDGGTLHLPSDQRVIEIIITRPHAYGSVDFPTTLQASWLSNLIDVDFGHEKILAGLEAGINEIRISSADLPYSVVVKIDVEPTLVETWWFWVGIGVLLIALVIAIGLYRRQLIRFREFELERTAMHERAKISQDLHDAVGADLVRINMILNRVDHDIPREELARIAREANRTLRDIIWTSREPQTVDAVIAALVERLRTLAHEADIELRLELPDTMPDHPMQPERIRDLVLIVTETATNIVKHAQATVIRAYVRYSDATLHIVVIDNGIGFRELETHRGMGLSGMRQRAERSGMTLTLRSVPDVGTTVELIVPFEGVT